MSYLKGKVGSIDSHITYRVFSSITESPPPHSPYIRKKDYVSRHCGGSNSVGPSTNAFPKTAWQI